MVDRTFEVIGDVVQSSDVHNVPETTLVEDEDKVKKEENDLIEDPTIYGDSTNKGGGSIKPCEVSVNINNI